MPRIPDDVIERIKREVPVVRLAERAGVKLRKAGREELSGLCPFHPDQTPSLSISTARNVWQCFGCGAAGTSIDWVMRQKGVPFREAVDVLLREDLPEADAAISPGRLAAAAPKDAALTAAAGPARASRRYRDPVMPSPFVLESEDQEILNQYADFCHTLYKESAEAQAYVRKRGLDDPELVTRFLLGYQDRTLGLRLPTKETLPGRAVRERFERLGLFRADSGHAHFTGSLVIPIRDDAGNVVNLYGRKTRDDLRKGTPKHLYLPGERRGVFNAEALRTSGEIILCESLIDALTFWRHGFRNVTTSWGANGFSEDILDALIQNGAERVLIAYDRDEAGDHGAAAVSEKLIERGIECLRVLFPKGMDVNAVALKMTPADKTLALFVRSAEWIAKGKRPVRRPQRQEEPAAPPAAFESPAGATEEGSGQRAAEEKSLDPAPLAELPAAAPQDAALTTAATKDAALTTAAPKDDAVIAATAGPVPASGLVSLTASEAVFVFEDRRYRIRGLEKGLGMGPLRVTVKAEREGGFFAPPSPLSGWHLDTFDLTAHRARQTFERAAAHEMAVKEEVLRHDIGRILRALEDLSDRRLEDALSPKDPKASLTEKDRAEALALARDPELIERILEAFASAGVTGERANALVLYVAGVSRKLDRPLAVVIRSSSAAGKTALMDAFLSFIPEEEQERYSALTENVLFYFEGKDFKHKILAIAEEQGAERASYPLKLLQSEGQVKAASTGKDPETGRLEAKEYTVEGPVMILLTSTAIDIDEEFLNRCLVLTVDESREQTRRIHDLQREAETLEGFLRKRERQKLRTLHQNLQRLIEPILVFNPFARGLGFLTDQTRTRRDHPKYLTLIRAIALLHQHQREVKSFVDPDGETVSYIEVTREDIALGNRLASEVLGHSLSELSPQTRKLLILLHEWVTGECEAAGVTRDDFLFTRKQVREAIGWQNTQLSIHLTRLVDLEYLLPHRGMRGQGFVYELLYDGQGKDGQPFLLGLLEPVAEGGGHAQQATVPAVPAATTSLRGSDKSFRGESQSLPGSFRPVSGPLPEGLRSARSDDRAFRGAALREIGRDIAPEPLREAGAPGAASYPVSGRKPLREPRNGHDGHNGGHSSHNGRNGHAGPRLCLNLLRHPPSATRDELPPAAGPEPAAAILGR